MKDQLNDQLHHFVQVWLSLKQLATEWIICHVQSNFSEGLEEENLAIKVSCGYAHDSYKICISQPAR